jgi:hypothetical protein
LIIAGAGVLGGHLALHRGTARRTSTDIGSAGDSS